MNVKTFIIVIYTKDKKITLIYMLFVIYKHFWKHVVFFFWVFYTEIYLLKNLSPAAHYSLLFALLLVFEIRILLLVMVGSKVNKMWTF